ncbi:MAG: hypothetical protein ABIQ43_03400 [Sphingomonas sp.]
MATAAALIVLPATAQAMDVATFLAKASALESKGIFAIGSPDIALLKNEVTTAATAYRADIAADAAAKRRPRACPPPIGKASVKSNDLVASFQTIPPAQRGISVKTAFYRFMDNRFPCR